VYLVRRCIIATSSRDTPTKGNEKMTNQQKISEIIDYAYNNDISLSFAAEILEYSEELAKEAQVKIDALVRAA
jgi:hypothetical protein